MILSKSLYRPSPSHGLSGRELLLASSSWKQIEDYQGGGRELRVGKRDSVRFLLTLLWSSHFIISFFLGARPLDRGLVLILLEILPSVEHSLLKLKTRAKGQHCYIQHSLRTEGEQELYF
jgi:hypothetical protein